MEKNALASDAARAPELVAPAWFPPPQPIVPAAEAEECTYEGVSREDGTWVADIKFDGEEIRLGTYENAGAAAWAYDAARDPHLVLCAFDTFEWTAKRNEVRLFSADRP